MFSSEMSVGSKGVRRLEQLGRHFFKPPSDNKPLRVVITGAAGQIGYILAFMVAQGRMLGPSQPIILHLLELPMMEKALNGVKMELIDGAFPLVKEIITATNPEVGFKDADVCVMVGAKPRGPGMERKDLLGANAKIFQAQGEVLNRVAKKTVRVLVVGNPANTNALIMSKYAPSIPKENFTALTRLDQNRAVGQVAERLGVSLYKIRNAIIWGNHSATQFPDVAHAYVDSMYGPGLHESVRTALNNESYMKEEFVKTVQKRGAAIIAARKLSSAASAANAACDHVHDWFIGTRPGQWVSMAVPSNGQYGIPKGIVYSFPCTCKNFTWKIVEGLKIDDWSRQKMEITAKELLDERKMALGE